MVRSQTFPFTDHARATPGQLTWVWLNQQIDYDERIRKIHVHCLPKFHREVCEVCNEPVFSNDQFPPEIQEQIYRPSEGESYNVTVEIDQPKRMGMGAEDEIEAEKESDGAVVADLGEIT